MKWKRPAKQSLSLQRRNIRREVSEEEYEGKGVSEEEEGGRGEGEEDGGRREGGGREGRSIRKTEGGGGGRRGWDYE